ncbi:PucR C-terminal helix-turn-helix domain-containing protein [Amycolatopsis marina]|uniref:PucR C-terminal helix-turn-helix domain-containing protein n=1 Tax=Amycolatopsis marina TaxID=490629 RepID=A0A1I1A8E5_9PSEU|nr:helix-turn-helix domain-containing protein [Amycolatopsis marina]SFB33822.1 PucR C-terminal helix-turn-helix domain-containing protein [Amycolatopsis marina]
MVTFETLFPGSRDASLRRAFDDLNLTLSRISALSSPASSGEEGEEAERLLSLLPAKVAPIFRTQCGPVARQILREIQRGIPEYSRPIEGVFGKAIVAGIEQGILEFVERFANPSFHRRGNVELFRKLGRYEVAEGRNIHVLQSAYRIGIRVGWQRLSEFGQRLSLPVSTLCLLADALFAYTDELSALSVEGYTAAQAKAAGALERRRKRLHELIVADPPVAEAAIKSQALAAGWDVPDRVAVVVLERAGGEEAAVPEFDEDVLVDLESPLPCLVVPVSGDGPREVEPVPGWRSAVGPPVRLSAASRSLRWAGQVLSLVQCGVLPDRAVTSCVRHLPTLALLDDPALAAQLAERVLEPLLELPEKARSRLAGTLSSWLESRGGAPEVATRLRIHPQTVRYRMHQVEELFGERLRDPDERFALMVALRVRRLLTEDTSGALPGGDL